MANRFTITKEEYEKLNAEFHKVTHDDNVTESAFVEATKNALGEEKTKGFDLTRFYKALDINGDKTVDRFEIGFGFSFFFKGSISETLQMQFKIMDADGSGTIDLEEVKKFFRRCLEARARVTGRPWNESSWTATVPHLERSFKALDKSGSNEIKFDELIKAVLNDPDHPMGLLITDMIH